MQTTPQLTKAPVRPVFTEQKLRLGMALLGVVLGLAVATASPQGELSRPALQALGLLVAAICFWIGRVWDDYVVALCMAIGWVGLDIVPFETAFATFHSTTWWLMLGAMGLGLGVARSGLLRRATLLMLNKLPRPMWDSQPLFW